MLDLLVYSLQNEFEGVHFMRGVALGHLRNKGFAKDSWKSQLSVKRPLATLCQLGQSNPDVSIQREALYPLGRIPDVLSIVWFILTDVSVASKSII